MENSSLYLNKILHQVKYLISFSKELKNKNIELESTILEQEIEIKNLKTSLKGKEQEIKNLKFAKSIISSDKEKNEIAKRKLNLLVQNIDKCISVLNKQDI